MQLKTIFRLLRRFCKLSFETKTDDFPMDLLYSFTTANFSNDGIKFRLQSWFSEKNAKA